MCIFSVPVLDVSATKIFARMIAPGRQVLAYQMQLAAESDVAMILPIPVPPNSPEDAVRFISLEGYPDLFEDLWRSFHPPAQSAHSQSLDREVVPLTALVVHKVGAFVASFVPSLADFARLDPQFRIPAGTVDAAPLYADWGFAVFQLAATRGKKAEVHPMAFEFPTRQPDHLFFPTVHVHDGELHEYAEFSHTLYGQGVSYDERWDHQTFPAHHSVKLDKVAGLIDGEDKLAMLELVGIEKNQDQWVPHRGVA